MQSLTLQPFCCLYDSLLLFKFIVDGDKVMISNIKFNVAMYEAFLVIMAVLFGATNLPWNNKSDNS